MLKQKLNLDFISLKNYSDQIFDTMGEITVCLHESLEELNLDSNKNSKIWWFKLQQPLTRNQNCDYDLLLGLWEGSTRFADPCGDAQLAAGTLRCYPSTWLPVYIGHVRISDSKVPQTQRLPSNMEGETYATEWAKFSKQKTVLRIISGLISYVKQNKNN